MDRNILDVWTFRFVFIEGTRLSIFLYFRWFIPFIGHMGIATSAGVIRDFAGPYYVSVSMFNTTPNIIFWEVTVLDSELKKKVKLEKYIVLFMG